MRQEIGEALSALADGEASELDLRRVLRSIDDPAVLDTWARWHRHADALHGGYGLARQLDDASGFLQRVRDGISAADAVVEVKPEVVDQSERHADAASIGARQRWWSKPVGGLAVAASVAAVAVLVGQNFPLDSSQESVSTASSTGGGAFALPAFPLSGGNTVPVGSSLSSGSTPAAHLYQDLARERLNLYRGLHAEQASMSGREGLFPYVRAGAVPNGPKTAESNGEAPPVVSPSTR